MMTKWMTICFLLIQWISVSWAVKCLAPPSVENSRRIIQADESGTRVTYACLKGRLFGNMVLSCNASKLWDAPPPVCREMCGVPRKIQNGQLAYPHYNQEAFPVHSKVRYECVQGFQKESGDPSATCRDDFLWEDASLVCVRKSANCFAPPSVENSRQIIQADDSGIRVTYVCLKGRLFGNRFLFCNGSRVWDAPPPVCREMCGVPRKIQNALLADPHYNQEAFPVHSKVRYECVQGFQKESGDPSATCRDDLLWDDASLVCVRKSANCPTPPLVENSRQIIQVAAGVTRVTYTCDKGRLFGNRFLFCDASQVWDAPPPVCREMCGVPTKIQNAQLAKPYSKQEAFPVHSNVRYECLPGYKEEFGDPLATCRDDFLWEDASLVCVPMECPNLAVRNGEITSGLKARYVTGDRVTVQCAQGFRLEGSQSIACNEEETWVPELPKCVKPDFTYCGIKLEKWKPFLEKEKLCLEEQKAALERNVKDV